MQDPIQFYTAQKTIHELELQTLKKQLITLGTFRLLVFLATVFCIYFFLGNAQLMIISGFVGFGVFLLLLLKHGKLQYQRDIQQALVTQNQLEIDVESGDFSKLDEGNEFIDATHFFSYDIDLFGRGSFFQSVNRTATKDGKEFLNKLLTSNDTSSIIEKQVAIKELANKPKWRQHFSALASLVNVQHSAKAIVALMHNYKTQFQGFVKWLPIVFSVISVLLIALVSFSVLNFNVLVIWFFIGLGISGKFLKKVNYIYQNSGKAKKTFSQYYKLLAEIENTEFSAKILKEQQERIQTERKKASAIFAQFSKELDALDQRNNWIIAIFGNGLFLRDMLVAYKIEKWIEAYAEKTKDWFEVIAFFDAQNSLANFAFNNPDYVYATLNSDKNVIKSEQLGHPLLRVKKRIDNDFTIENEQFFIITGANMAGKSTFLRTVSLAIVMSNVGLPVCAKSFEFSPIKLITSMRTSDSLADDESYFFSELKRLKFIVEEINPATSVADYFIILDEILKGTNSTDKAIGSKKFVQKLVASNSTGIIATHDLSLCETAKELTEVENYYFDAEIINDELHFDYKLKDGVCKNMNASFLLKKMEIV